MTRLLAKIVSCFSRGGCRGGGNAYDLRLRRQEGCGGARSVQLGGTCTAFQDCQAVTGKVVECRCTIRASSPVRGRSRNWRRLRYDRQFLARVRPGTRCTATDLSLANIVCLPVAKTARPADRTQVGAKIPRICDGTQHCVVARPI